MAEYIDREAVRNALYEADAITMKGVKIINNFPAADVVEVVRCRDCIYCKKEDSDTPFSCLCRYDGCSWNRADHFCSYGERKQ